MVVLTSLKDLLLRLLTFIRVVDAHDGLVSLTNLALIIVLVKLAKTPVATLVDTVPLVLSLANYSYKKYLNVNATEGQ